MSSKSADTGRASQPKAASLATSNNNDDAPSAKKFKLTDLPAETLSVIADQTGDIDSILEVANSNNAVFEAVQKWQCAKCSGGIFVVQDSEERKLVPRENDAKPFTCESCGGKFCGGQQRKCNASYKCNGCEKFECYDCMDSHAFSCGMCMKFDHHCIKCQGDCSSKSCNLCGFSICENHGAKCDKCGIMTCGIHDYSVDTCSHCEKGLCSRCHSHGDSMWHCGRCEKRSCNAGGDGNDGCPEFVFKYYDWPVCTSCHEALGGSDCDGDY